MADDDNDESNRFKNNEAPSQHHQRRFSSQLQPINEELTQRFNKQRKQPPNFRTPTQYDCGSSFNTGSQNKLPIRTIVMPKIENSLGHVNPAYDGFGDDDSDDDEKEKIIPPPPSLPSPPQSFDPKRPSRQVSFDPEQSNAEKQNSINVPNDSNNVNKNEKPKIEPKSSLKKQSSNEGNEKNDDEKNIKDAKEKLPEWDRFVTLPPPDEDETQKSEWVEVAIRWLKIFAYLFTFVMILMLSVCSKSLTMLMTSMASVNHTVAICNSDKHYYTNPPLEHDRPYKAIYMATTTTRLAWVWCLYFASVAPYLFAFGRSVRIIYFKTFKIPRFETFCTVFVAETLHCIGLSIIVFILLPQMGVIKGVMMMNVVCFVPSIIRLLVEPSSSPTGTVPEKVDPNKILNRNSSIISVDESTISELIDEDQGSTLSVPKFDHLKLATNRRLAIINCSLQSLMITCWTFIAYHDKLEHFYLMPIALILVSFEWWENYVIPDMMKSSLMFLSRVCNDLKNTRYFVFTLILPWKILLIFSMMVLNEYIENGSEVTGMLFKNFTDGFRSATIDVWRDKGKFYSGVLFDTDHHQLHVGTPLWPLWILLIHVSVTYLDYAFAKFTCKVCFQTISFSIPLCLTVPVTVSFLWGISSVAVQDKCELVDEFEPFQYIFWNQNDMDIFDFDLYSIFICTVWTIGFINQVTNTFHIWNETSDRLASTEQLFVSPMYNSVMIDQSLILNRRCFKLKFSPVDEEEDHEDQPPPKDVENNQENAEKPMLDGSDGNKQGDELRQELPLYSYNPMYDYANQMESLVHGDAKDSAPSSMVEEDWTKDWKRVCEMMGIEEDSIDAKTDPADDETIRIYVCATMWHEDQNEMFQMLKAVMRLDYEQGIRRITKKTFGHMKKSIFEIEVNIYFDDAFEQGKTDDEDDRVVNRFVEQLIDTIGPAANQVFGQNLHLETPTIVPTPYGGKLIWKMPFGTNRLIAHIKDKNLIRHRKRWSQCMYMYYLLGYRLAARKDLSLERKKTIMNNTFVLALDGDINFRPQAVDLVVDLMKKNNNLGAACGRIHPIGSGPIVWYQKFEYAMGHWLQKATEHVIGCVLCSPGCFSLFRARALMDKSVMNKYTTKPTAAQHFVQYDQGEDRWLCTLLLQRGWRIEYCAASDSFTHAPEGFAEFYTQRRRWGPSTMANILDLLGDYKQTVKTNDNISNLYILYQAFLMLGTIISPGTIFLMVVSAMNTVMGLSTQTSLLYNMIPLLAFLFVCLMFKDNNIKITFATILSVIYALLMLAVLVGTGIDMYTQGFFSPNSLFFSAMMASFIVAACLHPQEFACVIPLPIYMLFIPSMYMLLTIYSITNMNIVSWGTREVKSKLSAKELQRQKEEEEAKAKAAASKKKSNFLNLSNVGGTTNGLFTCMCCSGSAQNDNVNGTIQEIKSEVKEISKLITKEWCNNVQGNQDAKSHQQSGQGLDKKEEKEKSDLNNQDGNVDKIGNDGSTDSAEESSENEIRRRSPPTTRTGIVKKPRWIRNNARLNTWKIRPTPEREEEFWKKMISKYLYPLDEDLKEKERISSELEDLRNKWVFAFMFLNIIFILFVFMLQIHKDVFGIDIPVGVNGTTRKYDDDIEDFVTETNVVYTRMDPINLTLVIFFGAILIIQCIGMFIHRFGTLAHLLAYTEIHEKRNKFDYCQVVEELIRDKTRNTRRYKSKKKANKNGKNTSNSNNTDKNDGDNGDGDHDQESGSKPDDSANSSDVEVKPMEYGDLVVAAIQKLTSDQSQLDKMSKIKRKNTMLAIKRHEKHQLSNQARLKDRRDSIASSASSIQRQSSNASMQYNHRKVFPTNSNMSQMSQVTIVDTSSIKSGDQNQANHQQSTSAGLIQQQPMSAFFSSSNNDPGSQQESSSTF